jgi:hypothetical protein
MSREKGGEAAPARAAEESLIRKVDCYYLAVRVAESGSVTPEAPVENAVSISKDVHLI